MDSSMDSSGAGEETQATQLLERILKPQDSSYTPHSPLPNGQKTHLESRSSIFDGSAPRQYDYHGLASTQTQSLPVDGDTNAPLDTPTSPEMKDSSRLKGTKHGHLNSDEKLKPFNKAVSFQSPSPKKVAKLGGTTGPSAQPPVRSTTLPAARTVRREPSEDSFAGDGPVDPAQQFLASSRRFDVPLSELRRLADTSDTTGQTSFRSPARRRVPPIQAKRFPTPEGKILVESTPSLSGGSQSQLSEDEQPSQAIQIESLSQQSANISRQQTEEYLSGSEGPSSSYLANLENRQNDFPVGGTQMEPTQPSTQIATQAEDYTNTNTMNHQASVPDSGTSSKKRAPVSNLLNLVSPSKRHRYEHLVQSSTRSTSGSGPTVAHTQHNETQLDLPATQPSEEVELPTNHLTGRSSLEILSLVIEQHSDLDKASTQEQTQLIAEEDEMPPPRRRFPTKSSVQNTSQRPNFTHAKNSRDVVPDSEPIREEAEIPKQDPPPPNARPVSTRRSRRSLSNDDIVPDSMDMDVDGEPEPGVSDNLTKTGPPASSDDEDDVPLARNFIEQKFEKAPKTRGDVTKPTNTRKTYGEKKKGEPKKRKSSGTLSNSWDGDMVPSSIQNEEQTKSADGGSSQAGSKAPKSRGKGRAPAITRAKDRPTKRRRKSTKDGDDGNDSSGNESEDETRTVSDKASMHAPQVAENEIHQTAGQPSRKRKRAATKQTAPTPVTRQTRRMQSALTASISGAKDATRIFGFWKQDGYWYPGTIVSHEGENRYKVLFDDSAEATLQLDHLRTYKLEVGDMVVPHSFRSVAKVVDVSKFHSGIISVDADNFKEEVSIRDIKIQKAFVLNNWKDRHVTPDSIRPLQPKRTLSSTPSRASIANLAPDTSRGKWLEHTAVVVTATLNTNNNNNREPLLELIKKYGGTVLEDWSGVLHMGGKHDSTGQQRWSIRQNDVHWIGKSHIDRVFLLGDQPSAKAKYLLALAIGIPCVSFSWLNDKDEDPITRWPAHLLPQGECEQLSARLSQQVNLLWGTDKHDVTKMMKNSTAFKLFDKSSVLCVGREVFPQRIGSNARLNDVQKQAAVNAVTQIILAMGADYVEAVPDIKHASKAPTHYDYIVIKKPEEYNSSYRGTSVVLWQWVKDCLIASRKLPHQKWELQEDEYSQEI